jgi:hypothetical protein
VIANKSGTSKLRFTITKEQTTALQSGIIADKIRIDNDNMSPIDANSPSVSGDAMKEKGILYNNIAICKIETTTIGIN